MSEVRSPQAIECVIPTWPCPPKGLGVAVRPVARPCPWGVRRLGCGFLMLPPFATPLFFPSRPPFPHRRGRVLCMRTIKSDRRRRHRQSTSTITTSTIGECLIGPHRPCPIALPAIPNGRTPPSHGSFLPFAQIKQIGASCLGRDPPSNSSHSSTQSIELDRTVSFFTHAHRLMAPHLFNRIPSATGRVFCGVAARLLAVNEVVPCLLQRRSKPILHHDRSS